MNKINSIENLLEGIKNYGPEVLEFSLTTDSIDNYNQRIKQEKFDYPMIKQSIDHNNWFMPKEYQKFDIVNYLKYRVCEETGFEISDPDVVNTTEYIRMEQELKEFQNRDLIQLLRQMKYIIDTLRQNNIVWGVGRGSSVASYVLYLLDVHKIDSVKYNLPLNEFFKGENNG